MNAYKLSDIFIGMKESFSRVVTAEMMDQFLEISGDENPLHNDETYAREKGFPGRVVYGMLTASLISTLGGGVYTRKILFNIWNRGKICKAGIYWR